MFFLLSNAGDTVVRYQNSDSIIQLIVVLLIMIAVAAAAYFVTRLVAGGALRMQRQMTRMRVVDRIILARDRAIVVVLLNNRYFVVGVGQDITLLAEVDGADYPVVEQIVSGDSAGFLSVLQDKLSGKRRGERNAREDWPTRDAHQEEVENALRRMRERTQNQKNDEAERE